MAKEGDRRITIWARVRLGGERLVDVGREMGYKDGSGILQVVKRLERHIVEDKELKKKLDFMKETMSSVES